MHDEARVLSISTAPGAGAVKDDWHTSYTELLM